MSNKKKEKMYVSIDDVLEKNCEFNLIYGSRNTGKSFVVKEFLLNEAISGKKFAYIKRNDEDLKNNPIQKYFADTDIYSITNGKCSGVSVFSGDIWLTAIVEGRVKRQLVVGHVFNLGKAEQYKSRQYPDVYYGLLEEFFSDYYYRDEEDLFFSLMSTIFRDRMGKVFFVGNPENKFNPILRYWGVEKIVSEMKCGELMVLEVDKEKKLNLAIKRTDTKRSSGMVGGLLKNIVDNGEWNFKNKFPLITEFNIENIILTRYFYESMESFVINKCVSIENGRVFYLVTPPTKKSERFCSKVISTKRFTALDLKFHKNFSFEGNNFLTHARNNDIIVSGTECAESLYLCLKEDGFI